MSASGSWHVITDSPVGKQSMELELVEDGSSLTGKAVSDAETVEITEGAVDGTDLTWKLAMSKPLKMGLRFTVVQDGDSFAGTVKAGMFPAMKVSGTRS